MVHEVKTLMALLCLWAGKERCHHQPTSAAISFPSRAIYGLPEGTAWTLALSTHKLLRSEQA